MNSEIIDDLHWFRPPGEEPWQWWWVAVAVLLAAALWVAWRWRRKKKLGQSFFKPAPPHVRALKALAALTVEDELEFVQQVSLILRVYIQERFGLRAPHRSTEEFLWEAERNESLTVEQREALGGFLRQCDLVKFARHHVGDEQRQELLASARRFVEATIPQEEASA